MGEESSKGGGILIGDPIEGVGGVEANNKSRARKKKVHASV